MTDWVAPDENRCQFLFSNGNQCRDLRDAGADHGFCKYHFDRIQRDLRPSGDFLNVSAEEILPLDSPLDSAVAVNGALTRVFRCVIEGRLTPRHAAALGYLSQLIISTLPGMTREAESAPAHNLLGRDPDAALDQLAHSLQRSLAAAIALPAPSPAPASAGQSPTNGGDNRFNSAPSPNDNGDHPSPAAREALQPDDSEPN